MKLFDENCFALLLKTIDHGMKEFTLKIKNTGEFKVGNSNLVYSGKCIIQKYDDLKCIYRISLTHKGRKLQFKARCQVMDWFEGYERKSFGFIETDSNGLYEHSFLESEIENFGKFREQNWYPRFHVTLIN